MHIFILVFPFAVSSLDCSKLPDQEFTYTFYSDLDDWVVGNLNPNGAFAIPNDNNPIRFESPWGLKIWESEYPYDPYQDLTCYIGKHFFIQGNPISATLDIRADDSCTVKMNGFDTGCFTSFYYEVKTCDMKPYVIKGINLINITVTNKGNVNRNYAGVNYKLIVKASSKAIDLIYE